MPETSDHSKRILVEIFSKPGCHLCEEAKDVLKEAGRFFEIEIREVNIEEDERILEKYQYDIPVIWINGRKAFKHKVNSAELRKRLEKEKTLL